MSVIPSVRSLRSAGKQIVSEAFVWILSQRIQTQVHNLYIGRGMATTFLAGRKEEGPVVVFKKVNWAKLGGTVGTREDDRTGSVVEQP